MKVKERYDIKRLPRKLKKGLKKISLKYELGFEDNIFEMAYNNYFKQR